MLQILSHINWIWIRSRGSRLRKSTSRSGEIKKTGSVQIQIQIRNTSLWLATLLTLQMVMEGKLMSAREAVVELIVVWVPLVYIID